MQESSNLKKILQTSPEILIKKAFRKAYGKFTNKKSRNNDYSNSTYPKKIIEIDLQHQLFEFPDSTFLNKYKEQILFLASKSLSHEFELLDNQYRNISYANKAIGRDKIKYTSEIDTVSKALSNINNSNIAYSKEILKNIDFGYEFIDWQRDYISGYRWSESKWFQDIKYGNVIGTDIKQVWELGRMQDLLTLSFAYKLDSENKEFYLNEFKNRIFDFWALNPPRFGSQWKTSMDIGIRAVNVLATYQLFVSEKVQFDEQFVNTINEFLYSHLIHILENPEYSEGQRGNHYLTNVASILILLYNFKETETNYFLFEKYFKNLSTELSYQFYNDGGNFESSITYHLLSSELVFMAFNYFKKSKSSKYSDIIGGLESFKPKLSTIKNFSLNVIHKRYIPKIGDFDSGKYFSIFPNIHYYYNFFYQLSVFDGKKDYLGHDELANYIAKNQKSGISHYQDSGISIFRSNFIEATISYPPVGQNGKGGHNHNDIGSFVISFKGKPVFIDPGSYCYTSNPNERNKFRSTNYHNVLQIGDFEQRVIPKNSIDDLFWIFDKKSDLHFLTPYNNHIQVVYKIKGKPVIREFKFSDTRIIIDDTSYLIGEKKLRFHIHPSSEIDESDVIRIIRKDTTILIENNSNYYIEDYEYSPKYGTKVEAKRIVFLPKAAKTRTIITII